MISDAIDNLDCAANGLKWLLSFGAGKQRAIEAYEQLKVLLEGEYGQNVQRALTEVEELENVSDIQAWEEFERYPVRNCRKITDATCLGESPEIQGKRL